MAPAAESTPDSTTDVAKQQAGEIAGTAKDAGQHVLQSAKEQVGEVTQEAGRQARDLIDQVRSEATEQAAIQQQRAAGGLRSLADELSGMVNRSETGGPATDLARQAAGTLRDVAQWLEDRDPGSVLDEVRAFARRRPGAYLAIAAGAGVLAGRLTRGLASHDDRPGGGAYGSSRATATPPVAREPIPPPATRATAGVVGSEDLPVTPWTRTQPGLSTGDLGDVRR